MLTSFDIIQCTLYLYKYVLNYHKPFNTCNVFI